MCTSCRGSLRDRPLQALMEMAPLAFGWDPRAGIGAPSDVPAVDLAVAQLDGRRGPGYANRLQHADDLGPPSHNLTVRLHPVQVRMQQRLERAPITLDDRGMRDWCDGPFAWRRAAHRSSATSAAAFVSFGEALGLPVVHIAYPLPAGLSRWADPRVTGNMAVTQGEHVRAILFDLCVYLISSAD